MKKIFYFTGGWCQPCQTLGPIMTVVGTHIPVTKVDVDYMPDVIKKFGVKSIPTVILIENDQEMKRFVGIKSYEEIMTWISNG